MNFIQRKIEEKYFGIIDIGTYKIRVGICKIHNNELELIGYGEKRQNTNDIIAHEFVNLQGVCKNITEAIEKAETDSGIQVHDIIINIPFDEIFLQSNKFNYIREKSDLEIDKEELQHIVTHVESQALKKHYSHIKNTFGYDRKDIRHIIGGFDEIKIDKEYTKKLLKTSPKEINFSLFNIFIPESKHELIETIGRVLGKKIQKIIPTEFAITKLFKKQQDVVIIDIGNSQTSIIVKKDNKILGIQKHTFGIDSLIKKIRHNYNRTKIEIIQTIDQNIYEPEKEEFLEIFKDILTISLEEILKTSICPSDFFMIGGGSNKFVKEYLSTTNLNLHNLKIAKNISFITPKIEYLDNIDSSKSNLNIYAMMMTTLSFIKKEKDPLERSLKQVLEKIEYTA